MLRNFAIVVCIILLVIGGLAGTKIAQKRKLKAVAAAATPPPESVSTAVAHEEQWQDTLTAIGSVVAAQGVTVAPDLAGIVREIAFESGAIVPKDALLIRLDTSSEQAHLRAAEAQVEMAKLNVERERKLRLEKMNSEADWENADATLKQNQANADTIRATIEKKTIRAPFAGQLGIRQVNLGQFVDVGKPIVSLQSLAPVYAEFSLPQQQLARLKTGMTVRLTTDSYPGRQFEGKLTAMNPDLDASTRSIGLQATFPNTETMLRPGMFARAEVLLPEQQKSLVIPRTAVLSAPFGDSVYVVESSATNAKPSLVVRQQFVRLGRARGDFVSVETGLKPGERIVSAGILKLRNGVSVVENNELTPKASDSPKPSDS